MCQSPSLTVSNMDSDLIPKKRLDKNKIKASNRYNLGVVVIPEDEKDPKQTDDTSSLFLRPQKTKNSPFHSG